MPDLAIYAIIVAGIAIFMFGGVVLDRYAPNVLPIICLLCATLCAGMTLVVLFGGAVQPKAILGGVLGTIAFYGYYRRIISMRQPREKAAEPQVARDWMGKPLDPK